MLRLGLFVSASAAAVLQPRATHNGWSLQSSSLCPSSAKACGGGACCPSSLYCISPAQDEVAACCTSSSSCRGDIEGGPSCADSSWSLWQGLNGNGFCCQAGEVGYYQSSSSTAGACGSSVPQSAQSARLVSAGSGAAAPTSSSASASASSSQPGSSAPTTTSTASGARGVFAHYMVGQMTASEATQDVQDAIAAGFDAFALNTHDVTDSWATSAISDLFAAAQGTSFKLFISCDVSWGSGGSSLSDFSSFIAQYADNPAYYTVNGRPFVSTFDGGTISNSDWQSQFLQPLINAGHTPFFVPDFDDASGFPNSFFSNFPEVDGAFSWEDAWPAPGNSPSNVSSDVASSLKEQAQSAGKVTMMPVSSFQFKYMGSGQDWYRIGESTLPERLAQVLQVQPDFVEVLTWNDGGESHFIGNVWADQIACCSDIQAYADGFDHTGWQQIITPFIRAYKAGATQASSILPSNEAAGSLWYRTLLTSASCSSSIANYQEAADAVNYAVLLPSNAADYTIQVYSNNVLLSTVAGIPGLNSGSVPGLQVGSAASQRIQVLKSGSVVASASGTKDVLSQSPNATCNWNYEVVGLS